MSGSERGGAAALPRVFLEGDRPCVAVRVSPASQRVQLKGLYGDRLKISLTAPPEHNRANRQLEGALAEWLGVARAAASVLAGHKSRDKVVGFVGIDETELKGRLEALLLRLRLTEKVSEGGLQGF